MGVAVDMIVQNAGADGLADLYADANRTAFLLSYLLAAAAVLVALLPMAIGDRTGETICGGLELIWHRCRDPVGRRRARFICKCVAGLLSDNKKRPACVRRRRRAYRPHGRADAH